MKEHLYTRSYRYKRIREYYKKLYIDEFDNFDKAEKLFERHELPKPTHKKLDNLNRSTSRKNLVNKNLPTKRSPDLDW